MIRCNSGHYYDESKHSTCPACGINLNAALASPAPQPLGHVGKTVPMNTPPPLSPSPPPAQPSNLATPPPIAQPGKTIAIFDGVKGGIEPVVGWLVCIEGPDRGRDYRIKAERNFIGRSRSMHICIEGDEAVSREKHAILTFNPKKGSFKIQPGESASLVYVNDEDLDVPQDLKPFDTIELGRTKLKFVPFCGTDFTWEEFNDQNVGFAN